MTNLRRFDNSVATQMSRWGLGLVRASLGAIFVWFGALKPLGLSPAEPLLLATVQWLPFVSAEAWLHLIGYWEIAIGLCFLWRKTLRLAIALLALQMVGTFMPLFTLPDVTFQANRIPYAPTMEGQYIIKNLLIVSAALAVGGTLGKAQKGL